MTNKEKLKNKFKKITETKWQEGVAIERLLGDDILDMVFNFFWKEIESIRQNDMDRVIDIQMTKLGVGKEKGAELSSKMCQAKDKQDAFLQGWRFARNNLQNSKSQALYIINQGFLKCDTCETYSKDVKERVNGFVSEIHGKEEMHTVCDACNNENLMDI